MKKKNLLEKFLLPSVDVYELEQLFRFHFRNAYSQEKQVCYGDSFTFSYSKKGKLIAIHKENSIDDKVIDELVKKIKSTLLCDTALSIGCGILFSAYPVTGAYKHKNLLQIIPIPKEAPRPNQSWASHPFIIEYNYRGCPDWKIDINRRSKKYKELKSILTVLVEGGISSILNSVQNKWVFIRGDETETPKAEYCQLGYRFDGMKSKLEYFSPIDEFSKLHLIEPALYYSSTGRYPDHCLTLPTTLSLSIDKFYSLDRAMQDKFLRASHWLQTARQILCYSDSAAYLALTNAIECILSKSSEEKRCEECNQVIQKIPRICECCKQTIKEQTGPTKLFYEFIENYAPSIPKNLRKEFYDIRSKLTHGNTLLPDRGAFNPKAHDADQKMRLLSQVVVVALYNWLHSN